ncbi:hypothetical protein [Treponema endosymbiont of Eucomonympha sp.]|uniref:hypothetical protein n=1 Tax=Treponema endosymbiont of Eucomonympha sp. TaxID=1580831 RepID=UPI0013968149|nr:hypothetical protein [Treponema endosymbiont of Eucomonympha sp.]
MIVFNNFLTSIEYTIRRVSAARFSVAFSYFRHTPRVWRGTGKSCLLTGKGWRSTGRVCLLTGKSWRCSGKGCLLTGKSWRDTGKVCLSTAKGWRCPALPFG